MILSPLSCDWGHHSRQHPQSLQKQVTEESSQKH